LAERPPLSFLNTWLIALTGVEAVRLLEHASAVSMIASLPDFRVDVSFRAYSVDGNRTDGATCEGKPVVGSGIFTIHFPPQ
jgi:hypothetical protein